MTHSDDITGANMLSPSPVTPVHQQLQRAMRPPGMPRCVPTYLGALGIKKRSRGGAEVPRPDGRPDHVNIVVD